MRVTDSQVHVWEADRPDRPWEQGEKAHQPTPFTIERLVEAMAEAGVDRAVLVPPRFMGYVNPNAYALEAAQRWPGRFAVMGRIDPRRPDLREVLEGWLAQPGMKGVRFTLRAGPVANWLRDGTMEALWPHVERLGIPVAIQACGQLPLLEPILERHPALCLIVDHMGFPADGPNPFADLEQLLALAKYPNVVVKASGLCRFTEQPYPFPELKEQLRRAYEVLGPRRMAWGSDYTMIVGRYRYREAVDLVREASDFLSAEDREWILDKTLALALRWDA